MKSFKLWMPKNWKIFLIEFIIIIGLILLIKFSIDISNDLMGKKDIGKNECISKETIEYLKSLGY